MKSVNDYSYRYNVDTSNGETPLQSFLLRGRGLISKKKIVLNLYKFYLQDVSAVTR